MADEGALGGDSSFVAAEVGMDDLACFSIKEGEVAEFKIPREQLEELLDSLPPGEQFVHFKMDSGGKVTVLTFEIMGH